MLADSTLPPVPNGTVSSGPTAVSNEPEVTATHDTMGHGSMSGKVSAADKKFMTEAAQGGMEEVELGRLAAANGSDADVMYVHRGLPGVPEEEAQAQAVQIVGKLSSLLYAIAIPSALLRPWIAGAIYVLVALIWLVPDRRIERALRVRVIRIGKQLALAVELESGCFDLAPHRVLVVGGMEMILREPHRVRHLIRPVVDDDVDAEFA